MICAPKDIAASESPGVAADLERLSGAALGGGEVAPQQCHTRARGECHVVAHRRVADTFRDRCHPLCRLC
jgi:hypothetical protein